MSQPKEEAFLAASTASICHLNLREQFNELTSDEKHYAHHMSLAAFAGTRILLRQVSPESEAIYDFILAVHKLCGGDWEKLRLQAGSNALEIAQFLEYASQFLDALGNYTTRENRKFTPRISEAQLLKIAKLSETTLNLFEKIRVAIYDIQHETLGLPSLTSQSGYYLGDNAFKESEILEVQKLLNDRQIGSENTRIRKLNSSPCYQVLISSKEQHTECQTKPLDEDHLFAPEMSPAKISWRDISLVYGDNSDELAAVIEQLEHALKYAANNHQSLMIDYLIRFFTTGDIQYHKTASRHWMNDKDPIVETTFGFIETYRDPLSIRGEWRGFVAIQNKEQSRGFQRIIREAEILIRDLPWVPSNVENLGSFEEETFKVPKYTSLDMLAFVASSIPAGTSIPNYADVVADLGTKNLSFENRINARDKRLPFSFLSRSDNALCSLLFGIAFGATVAFHELLGHGTGKLLSELSPGEFNFNLSGLPISPVSGERISTWYKPGEKWKPMFGNAYEECRCELVALHYLAQPEKLAILGIEMEPQDDRPLASDVAYVGWLIVIWNGLFALDSWDPVSNQWGNSHAKARYGIMRTLEREAPGLLSIVENENNELEIKLDSSKIGTIGRGIVDYYLLRLHVFRCSANEAGIKLFDEMTHVDERFRKYRELVLQHRPPAKQIILPRTVREGDEIVLKEYDSTKEGMIQSWVETCI